MQNWPIADRPVLRSLLRKIKPSFRVAPSGSKRQRNKSLPSFRLGQRSLSTLKVVEQLRGSSFQARHLSASVLEQSARRSQILGHAPVVNRDVIDLKIVPPFDDEASFAEESARRLACLNVQPADPRSAGQAFQLFVKSRRYALSRMAGGTVQMIDVAVRLAISVRDGLACIVDCYEQRSAVTCPR